MKDRIKYTGMNVFGVPVYADDAMEPDAIKLIKFTPAQAHEIGAAWTQANPFYELIKRGRLRFEATTQADFSVVPKEWADARE